MKTNKKQDIRIITEEEGKRIKITGTQNIPARDLHIHPNSKTVSLALLSIGKSHFLNVLE
jgi:hypothetical protein